MTTFYLYILYSPSLCKYYVGVSSNPQERLKKHLTHHRGFTARAKDWEMVYTEEFDSRLAALKREKQIKSWKSSKMIKQLISS